MSRGRKPKKGEKPCTRHEPGMGETGRREFGGLSITRRLAAPDAVFLRAHRRRQYDPTTDAALPLLPEWVSWNDEQIGVPAILIDRAVSAASASPNQPV